jgi:1-acyl-sn-glycerol-3-phosphate acyltransferase
VIEGTPVTERPTLYISNHISYLDIFVLGSILPGTFIAKSEIAKWPLFGQLARLQNSLFIERRSQKVGSQIQQEITIQPITVAYTHYEDERMDREARDYYAWYKPRKIVPHFMNALGLGSARVMVICHEPVKFEAFESRKACSRHCEIVIRQGLLDALDLEKEETVVMSR